MKTLHSSANSLATVLILSLCCVSDAQSPGKNLAAVGGVERSAAVNLLTTAAQLDGIKAQPQPVLQRYLDGPYVCPAEDAVVGVELTNRTKSGKTEKRHFNGLILRSDGFLAVPLPQISRGMSGDAEAEVQTIQVTLHPGTPHQAPAAAFLNHSTPKSIGMTVIKLSAAYIPAARLLLPDSVKAGNSVTIVWSQWEASAGRFIAVQKRSVKLAEPPKSEKEARAAALSPDEILLAEPLSDVPAGAAVIGPEGMAIGLLPSSAKQHDRFISFALLNQVTSCVVPVPTTDAEFGRLHAGQEGGNGTDASVGSMTANGTADGASVVHEPAAGQKVHPVQEMVSVSGGPIKLPHSVFDSHHEMVNDIIGCVADFQVDKFKVSNRDYYAFWKSVPERERTKTAVRAALYPLAWAITDPPYPVAIEDSPVLGVPLTGAQLYARAQGKRLLTAYEWCRAAFGPLGDRAVPNWALRYMLDRQQTWKRLVEAHVPHVLATFGEQRARLNAENLDRAVRGLGPLKDPVGMDERFCVPFLSTRDADIELCRWSQQQVTPEVERLCRDWVDPLYIQPAGKRGYDVSPYGVHDMLMNGNERVVACPEQHVESEFLAIHMKAGIADPKMLSGLHNRQLEDWFTHMAVTGYSWDCPAPVSWREPPLLSRRIVASSERVRADTNTFCPSYNEKFVEICTRLHELSEMIGPINSLRVEAEWQDTFEFDAFGEGKWDFNFRDGHFLETWGPSTGYPLGGSVARCSGLLNSGTRWPNLFFGAERYLVPEAPLRPDEINGQWRGFYFTETPIYSLWQGISPFQRREMGRDWARDPDVHVGAAARSYNTLQQPAEVFLLPNGFRCAR